MECFAPPSRKSCSSQFVRVTRPLGQPRQTHADESHQGRLEEAKFLPLACHEDRLEEAKRLPRASVLSFLAFGEGLCDSPTRGRRFTCGGGGYA